ncbi:amidohydrolase family protein [Pseudaestuariivita sp.]|uniref:amidohydrolase family protein n=1 Tax=Pseudaestuariivita sp. TaxID=2211669 RepID=UPI004058E7D8
MIPENAANCHVHLIGDDYALSPKAVETPAAGTLDDWLAKYRAHQAELGCTKGVIVHSILYGTDNSITLDAVAAMGAGYAAVVLVPDDVEDAELDRLRAAGAKAVRLNYVHGGVLTWDGAKALAPRLAGRGMHIEMLAHSHLHLAELADDVRAMPCDVVFDHCAWPDTTLGVEDAGHQALRALLSEGKAWTKLSAPHRWSKGPEDALAVLTSLAEANSERCLWGSDWPHLMLGGVSVPDPMAQRDALVAALPGEVIPKVFAENPARLYGI